VESESPGFFDELSTNQAPEYLWIGCADSRVPANQIVDLAPGDMFVHRNVANLVVHTDLNCLSVIQYAVEVLHVKHVIVCGHYGCGGIRAALEDSTLGLIDNWLRVVQDLMLQHRSILESAPDFAARADRLSELNVIEQAANVCRTTLLRSAWNRGQQLSVHGWIYDLKDGLLRDLGVTATTEDEVDDVVAEAIARLARSKRAERPA
jgi:carbonic anhydrase